MTRISVRVSAKQHAGAFLLFADARSGARSLGITCDGDRALQANFETLSGFRQFGPSTVGNDITGLRVTHDLDRS